MNHAKKNQLNHIRKNQANTNEFLNNKSNNMGEEVMNSTIKKQEQRVNEIKNLIDSD